MRHIDHQQRAYLIGNFAELGEIDLARISACARHDHLGLAFQRSLAHRVVIDVFVFAYAVGREVEVFA